MESSLYQTNLELNSPRVVLIRTPIVQPKHHLSSLRAVPSIGLAYINAALKRKNFLVTIIDSPGESLFNYRQLKDSPLTINGLNADEIVSRISHRPKCYACKRVDIRFLYFKKNSF